MKKNSWDTKQAKPDWNPTCTNLSKNRIENTDQCESTKILFQGDKLPGKIITATLSERSDNSGNADNFGKKLKMIWDEHKNINTSNK